MVTAMLADVLIYGVPGALVLLLLFMMIWNNTQAIKTRQREKKDVPPHWTTKGTFARVVHWITVAIVSALGLIIAAYIMSRLFE